MRGVVSMNKIDDDSLVCEFCGKVKDTLYEGWFRTHAAFNEFAQGTASAGLLQLRLACKDCLEEAILNKISLATEIPSE